MRERFKILTPDIRRKVARRALERMEQEYQTDFAFLATFRTTLVLRFLAWINEVQEPNRLEAALSVTCRNLKLKHVGCRDVPNWERWANDWLNSPLRADLDWRP